MKKLLSLFLFMILAVFLASPALALTINAGAIDVGSEDDINFLESTTLPNSGNAEQEWINDLFGEGVFVDVIDTVANDWVQVDNEDYIWAYELPIDTYQFFIKVGTGGTNLPSHIAYDNNASLLYAVVDLTDWALFSSEEAWTEATIPNNINIGRVSHVGAPVPEPSTILLLGLGLVGLAGFGRKKIKS
jgi:hypothetical protein